MLSQILAGAIAAVTALATDRQQTMQIFHGAGAIVDGMAKLLVSDCVANTDIHAAPLLGY
jgi:hypothetical protein